jgi:hypothetical protein
MTFIVNGTDTAFERVREFIEEKAGSPIAHADYLRIYDPENRYQLIGLALGITCKNGRTFYLKYSEKWRNAGLNTGQFKGAGMTVNMEHYKKFIVDTKADVIFYEKVRTVIIKAGYYCPHETFVQNSFEHVQNFDNQPVQVIQFDNHNKFFERIP